jgi:hypothetical protein
MLLTRASDNLQQHRLEPSRLVPAGPRVTAADALQTLVDIEGLRKLFTDISRESLRIRSQAAKPVARPQYHRHILQSTRKSTNATSHCNSIGLLTQELAAYGGAPIHETAKGTDSSVKSRAGLWW